MAGAKPVAWNGKMAIQRTNSAVDRIPMVDIICGHAQSSVMQNEATVLQNYVITAFMALDDGGKEVLVDSHGVILPPLLLSIHCQCSQCCGIFFIAKCSIDYVV